MDLIEEARKSLRGTQFTSARNLNTDPIAEVARQNINLSLSILAAAVALIGYFAKDVLSYVAYLVENPILNWVWTFVFLLTFASLAFFLSRIVRMLAKALRGQSLLALWRFNPATSDEEARRLGKSIDELIFEPREFLGIGWANSFLASFIYLTFLFVLMSYGSAKFDDLRDRSQQNQSDLEVLQARADDLLTKETENLLEAKDLARQTTHLKNEVGVIKSYVKLMLSFEESEGATEGLSIVIDGHTIVQNRVPYRLMGFATAEIFGSECLEELNQGKAAMKALEELVHGQEIELRPITLPQQDEFGEAAEGFLNGESIAKLMIESGHGKVPGDEVEDQWCS